MVPMKLSCEEIESLTIDPEPGETELFIVSYQQKTYTLDGYERIVHIALCRQVLQDHAELIVRLLKDLPRIERLVWMQ